MTASKQAKAQAAAERSLAAKWRRVRFRDNRAAETKDWALCGPGCCWCGAEFGHDWPGKADGGPHPRDWPGRVDGYPYRGGG